MSKHTPGPWELIAGDIVDENGNTIAHAIGGDGRCFIDEEDNIECRANARLIAAAPELLATLESVRSWMEDCLFDRGQPDLPSRRQYDAVLLAITKATRDQ